MSTRGIIAALNEDGSIAGRYHHFDSYPDGLGKTLWNLYNGFFKKNLDKMLDVLIEQHPGGWSTIVETGFSLEPGFIKNLDNKSNRPQCYCHGDRQEKGPLLTEKDMTRLDYTYLFDKANKTMTIFHYNKMLKVVNLDGFEPDWEGIERMA